MRLISLFISMIELFVLIVCSTICTMVNGTIKYGDILNILDMIKRFICDLSSAHARGQQHTRGGLLVLVIPASVNRYRVGGP